MTVNIEGLGKITANKEVLNWLCIVLNEAQDSFENKGTMVFSKQCRKQKNAIYDELDAKGYFDSVR